MPVKRKVFRIEELAGAGLRSVDATPVPRQFRAEPATLRSRGGIEERLCVLKDETDFIHRAISRTKQELAALHVNGLGGERGRVVRELDAVVGGTEQATAQILAAAEDIDDAANTLSAALRHEQEQALAQDIRDQVISIFEACNF